MYLMFTELHNDSVVIQLFLDMSWQLCDASNEWRRCLCTPTKRLLRVLPQPRSWSAAFRTAVISTKACGSTGSTAPVHSKGCNSDTCSGHIGAPSVKARTSANILSVGTNYCTMARVTDDNVSRFTAAPASITTCTQCTAHVGWWQRGEQAIVERMKGAVLRHE